MSIGLILWYIFCFFYGNRVTNYFFLGKPKTKERTLIFAILTIIFFVGMIKLIFP